MKKRIAAILLALCMAGSLATTAFAGDETSDPAPSGTTSNIVVTAQENASDASNIAGTDETEADPVAEVQKLIDALPEVTAENAADVTAQLEAIDAAKQALSDEQSGQVDWTDYDAAGAAILALEEQKKQEEQGTQEEQDAQDDQSNASNDAAAAVPAAQADSGSNSLSAVYVSENGNDTTGDGSQDNPVASLAKAVDLAADGATITILTNCTDPKKSSRISSTITIDKKVTIDLGNHTITSTVSNKNATANAFLVTGTGDLTLKQGAIVSSSFENEPDINMMLMNGGDADQNLSKITYNRRAIEGEKNSKITLINVNIGNFATAKGNGGVVLVNGGTLTVSGGALGYYISSLKTWVGNAACNGGAIYAKEATVTIENTKFYGNYSKDTTVSGTGNYNDYKGGGAVYLSSSTNATITGGVFQYNFDGSNSGICGGGAIRLDQAGTVTIKDSYIVGSQCFGSGAGIYTRMSDNLTISNTTIKKCLANRKGGGIYVCATTGNKVTLSGNTIDSNTSDTRGGGISLYLDKHPEINLLSGTISNNKASWGGGIDYTTHGMQALKLTNVVITQNTAARGGGVWACPTSEVEIASTLGGLIYGNTATGKVDKNTMGKGYPELPASGDEVRYEGKDANNTDPWTLYNNPASETTTMALVRRTPDGYPINWYKDEARARYTDGNVEKVNEAVYDGVNQSFGAHSEISQDAIDTYKSTAKLYITGNTATERGGGIATNSPIEIGEKYADMYVTVTKSWDVPSGVTKPTSVTVNLIRIDAKGNRVPLDQGIELNEENKWRYTFYDLPSKYTDENGVEQGYSYTVEETVTGGKNWTGTADTVTYNKETENQAYTITLKNVYTPDPTPTPAATATPKPTAAPTAAPTATPTATIPQTGDSFPYAALVVLMCAAVAGFGVVLYRKRKNGSK